MRRTAAPAVEAATDFHEIAVGRIEGASGLLRGHVHLKLHRNGCGFPEVVEVGDRELGGGRWQDESAVGIVFPDVGGAFPDLDKFEFDGAAGLVGDVGGASVDGGSGLSRSQ